MGTWENSPALGSDSKRIRVPRLLSQGLRAGALPFLLVDLGNLRFSRRRAIIVRWALGGFSQKCLSAWQVPQSPYLASEALPTAPHKVATSTITSRGQPAHGDSSLWLTG